MRHTPATARGPIRDLHELRARAGRSDQPFSITLQGPWPCPPDVIDEFAGAGVDRLVFYPWQAGGDGWHRDLAAFETWLRALPQAGHGTQVRRVGERSPDFDP
jgi:hypothetical protein